MKIKTLTSAMAFAMVMSAGVQAAGTVGFVDLTFGLSKADDPQRKEVHAGFGSLSGAVAIPAGANGTVALEGELRHDNHQGYIVDGNDMGTQGQLGAHYLHDFSGKKLGGFLAYADADHDGGNEHYQSYLFGVEGIADVAPAVTLYGQVGYANALNDNESSGGFDKAWFGRAGVAYSGFSSTLVKFEGEYARSKDYEDNNEDGRFWKLSLGGETSISAVKNLAVTYGVSYGSYDAKGDSDKIKETSVNVGIRYYFGGTSSTAALKSGLIGLPTIPLRAMSWTPAMD